MTQAALQENAYDLWHDRAVFHFLTDPNDRAAYLDNLHKALKPNGHLIIATFSDVGPLKCSGLDVERYDIEKMQRAIGSGFELVNSFREDHGHRSIRRKTFFMRIFGGDHRISGMR